MMWSVPQWSRHVLRRLRYTEFYLLIKFVNMLLLCQGHAGVCLFILIRGERIINEISDK